MFASPSVIIMWSILAVFLLMKLLPIVCQVTDSAPSDDRIPLYLGGFFSFGGPWDGSGVLPAVEMALDHINQRTDVLDGYELKMVWNDTRVSFLTK